MKKLIILFIAVAGFGVSSFAQSLESTGTATAKIILPLTVTTGGTTNSVMNFGNIAAGATAGTIVLVPAGTVTPSGGVTIPVADKGSPAAAIFDLTGDGASTFTITLPVSDHTVKRSGGTETMIINAFTSNPSGTGTLVAGKKIVNVGATLNVGASQAAGTYTSVGTFPITFAYN